MKKQLLLVVVQMWSKHSFGLFVRSLLLWIVVIILTVGCVLGESKRQKKTDSIYERYDVIDLVIEKLWSKSNPSETYSYKQLPFCDPKALTDTTLGEDLTGSGDSVISNYDIGFQGMFLHIAPSSSRYTIILQSCILFVVVIIIIIYF